ncbi:MAG: hypothetical protein GX589_05625 [Deltaproteobacteria bacterium]|nr:hypothetical protein [Deltaproteobacteria bacterium]
MGLIGWRFFEDDYSPDAIEARRDLEESRRSSEHRREKKRRRRQEALRKAKQAMRDEQYQQSQEFQEQFNKQFGASHDPSYGQNPNDPSNLYHKFDGDNKNSYREEVARRYGYMYNSYTDGDAPKLSRGMGPAHHQGVKRPQDVKHHAPLGPMAKRIRISIGWQPNSNGQDSQTTTSAKPDTSSNSFSCDGRLSGKLSRPF